MKKVLALFLCAAIITLTFPCRVLASGTETRAFHVEGGTLGTQYTYESHVLTFTQNGTYTVSMADGVTSTSTDRIAVANSVQATIILDGVKIDVSGISTTSALDMSGAGACTVTLAAGSNSSLKSGHDRPGIYVPNYNKVIFNGSGSLNASGGDYWPGIGRNGHGNIEIQSGTISAVGGEYSSAIGGSWGFNGGTIVISGGYVTASGGYDGSGIGGGSQASGGNVTISGGTVTASGSGSAIGHGGRSSGGSITVTGGTIKASGGMGSQPTNGSAAVYLTRVILTHITAQTPVTSLTTSLGDDTYGSRDVVTDGSGALYFYLPAGTEITEIQTATHDYTGSVVTTDTGGAAGRLRFPDLVVTGGTLGTDYTYDGGQLTILRNGTYTVSMVPEATQPGIDTIRVQGGVSADLTLDHVQIDASACGRSALDLTGASVHLALVGSNTLKSGANYAGISVPDGSSLTVTGAGSGTLSTIAGTDGAGIGGNSGENGGTVTITGGLVTAYSGFGAGIGGGRGGNGGTVTITGGQVTACGFSGAGIGGGYNGNGGTAYISGGSVYAAADGSAEGIGKGAGGSSSGILKQNANGRDVFLATLQLDQGNTAISGSDLGLGGVASGYGTHGLRTDGYKMLYLYLPEGAASAAYGGSLYTAEVVGGRHNSFSLVSGTSAFVVDLALANLSSGNSPTMAAAGDSYTGTLTPEAGYLLPKTIAVAMGGTTLNRGTDYTYDKNTGVVRIPNVSGNVQITAAGASPACAITVLPSNLDFGSVKDIYTGETAAQTVTVANTGNQTVTLIQPESTGYQITPLSSETLAPDETATFTVRPNASLSVGNHDEQIVIRTRQGAAANLNVCLGVTSGYKAMTLDDPATKITVSGSIQENAVLSVSDLTLDGSDASRAIQEMKRNSAYIFLLGANISLSQKYSGLLTLTIPVGAQYNGRMATILHAHSGVLETYHAEVKNGAVSLTVTSLSPFAVFLDATTADSSNPDANPDTASAAGSISANNPKTGQTTSPRLWIVLALSGSAALIWLYLRRKSKRNGAGFRL